MHYAVMNTPVGPLTVASTDKGLASVLFGNHVPNGVNSNESGNQTAIQQLSEYFEGRRTQFKLALDVDGTPFQKSVWQALQEIPYGETRSYGQIAKSLGRPGAARAVGLANHNNPLAVVIPCHRVIGHDGSLTGYAGGLRLKEQLLAIERRDSLFT